MKALIALLCILVAVAVADDADRCYFTGSVSWAGNEADYAVIQLSNDKSGFEDSLHLAEPDDYSFGWFSTYTIIHNQPWRLDCWLMLHGQTVPMPKYRALIMFPDDWECVNYVWYCRSTFEW
jgi:hypothetical protein